MSFLPSIHVNNGVSSPFMIDGSQAVIVMDGGVPRIVYIQQRPTYERLDLDINCNPQISHGNASNFVRSHNLSPKDRRVMQGVYTLLNDEPNWVWRNAAIDVHGENMFITFYAGSESNKFVVNLNENNGVSSSCREKGLRLRLSDGVKSIWNGIKSGARSVLGAIAGGGMKMLQFW